ncbi:MAG: sensor histidine kinase [Acidobacteriaceae bacterium]
MRHLIPRTIRGQLIAGTTLLQCVLVLVIAGYFYRQQRDALRERAAERLDYQVRLLSSSAATEIRDQRLSSLQPILDDMLVTPSVRATRITDLAGHTLADSDQRGSEALAPLSTQERTRLQQPYRTQILETRAGGLEAVSPIDVDGTPVALTWIYADPSQDRVILANLLNSALIFALLAIALNGLFSLLLARSVTRPLRGLLRGTKLLIRDPDRSGVFPLQTRSLNEAGELTRAFNTMVAALNEQRSGLNDTLALLDSMLANAPIGFAFYDRKKRYVRMNQFQAEMSNLSISRHLGRPVEEIFSGEMAVEINSAIESVFATGTPVTNLDLHGELPTVPGETRAWLVNFYPVHTGGDQSGDQVRWVGAVAVDTTERKLAEEMLRRTEKLAATGRLAASIAHEINNPLEAVTNLLYLLHQQPLDPDALQYAEMAQQEIARVSQITQQTLRFYRQASRPVPTNLAELLDSVLTLHQGRLRSTQVEIVRHYRSGGELLAFSGEMRQLFANLIGNALDAMPRGGRLVLSVRPSRCWNGPEVRGVRISVADTGMGMTKAVRLRIFDAFYTTKETTGTGLGLWVSSEIIQKHQGTVRVRSKPASTGAGSGEASSSGTVFMLFFPFENQMVETTNKAAEEDGFSPPGASDLQLGAVGG